MIATAYRLLAALLLLGGLLTIPPSASAAESYDSCAGYIDSLPATVSKQGVWCLRNNLSTNITTGNAITIAANNVTIDCNDFKIGGLAAGNGSNSRGILANGKQNATVRNCNVRGFFEGIGLYSGAGHLVEDNRLDNNLKWGIFIGGENNRVRRNAVYDTGGAAGAEHAYGIAAYADIIDNTVSGLFADTSGGSLHGITAMAVGANIRDNKVSGFDMTAMQGGGVNSANGIRLNDYRQRASGNQVVGGSDYNISGVGIAADFSSSYCQGNAVGGFTTNIDSDCNSSGNLIGP